MTATSTPETREQIADGGELAKLQRACRTMGAVIVGMSRSMEAARIEMLQNGPKAAMEWILNSLPDVDDNDPEDQWNGTETAQEWSDRQREADRRSEADQAKDGNRGEANPARPRVVCLCGSTRFYNEFQRANYSQTMAGEIVLSVGFYPHASAKHGHGEGVGHNSAEKVTLDELHRRKIDLADYVLVVSGPDGYFGESTTGEIRYAIEHGKPVEFATSAARRRAIEMGLVR